MLIEVVSMTLGDYGHHASDKIVDRYFIQHDRAVANLETRTNQAIH